MLRAPEPPGSSSEVPTASLEPRTRERASLGSGRGGAGGPAWVPWAVPVSLLQQRDLPAQTLQWDLGAGGEPNKGRMGAGHRRRTQWDHLTGLPSPSPLGVKDVTEDFAGTSA